MCFGKGSCDDDPPSKPMKPRKVVMLIIDEWSFKELQTALSSSQKGVYKNQCENEKDKKLLTELCFFEHIKYF